jgi:acetyltransferase
MTIRNLDYLFRPNSVAMIIDSDYTGQYAGILQRNLQSGGFSGTLMEVSAKKRSRFKIGPRVRLDKMPEVPDLAVICARLDLIADIIGQLGKMGTRAVIIAPPIHEGFTPEESQPLIKVILETARLHTLRILGPDSGGLLIPGIGLNASVAAVAMLPGKIALITQSPSIASAIIDHATCRGIGFSAALHLGESADIDLADVLDWFAEDHETERILVQFDNVKAGRKFMSAARASARNKPVVAIRNKQIGHARGGKLPFCQNDVYEAALNRAGWVEVATLGEAFEAAQAMARLRPMVADGLTILANGYGLGSITADMLLGSGGKLARLEADTLLQLAELLHSRLPLSNPIELPPTISRAQWAEVLRIILADPNTSALMTVYSPSAFVSSNDVAEEIGRAGQVASQNIFSCWVGGYSMQEAQHIAEGHGVLSHNSPEQAVGVFIGLVNYYRNRELLMQMPPSLAEGYSTDLKQARAAVAEGLEGGARQLPSRLARKLLQAFAIEAVESRTAASAAVAVEIANEIGYPVDLGLVLANAVPFDATRVSLQSPSDIHIAIRSLRQKARSLYPDSRVSGYRLRRSAPRSGLAPVSIGVADDALFGPIIFLGPSSAAHAGERRFVVGLPPLNLTLARDMVLRSGLADELPADVRTGLENSASAALVRLSQLLSDIDEVVGVELDPLHVESDGVLALDGKILLGKRSRKSGSQRFAISPYPKELEHRIKWQGEKLLIRPIRPEDEPMLGQLLESLTADDSRMRFFVAMRRQTHSQLARFTQIDYDREMSFVVIREDKKGKPQALGEARLIADADNRVADLAMVVSSSFKGKGLGGLLLQQLIDYAKGRGIATLRFETLPENKPMQKLGLKAGFSVIKGGDPGTLNMHLQLAEPDTE